MAKKTDDDPNFSACRLIFITPLTTAGYENKIDSGMSPLFEYELNSDYSN